MGCVVLRRTFHTAPEQEHGPEQGEGRMGYVPIFQVLKLFQVSSSAVGLKEDGEYYLNIYFLVTSNKTTLHNIAAFQRQTDTCV